MSSNEKNVCNVLRETWRATINLVNYLSTFLRKIKDKIQALINRLKNTIIRRLLATINDVRNVISNFLGLQTLENNKARQDFCSILYTCKPAIEQISKFVSPDLFSKIFGPESIKTIDLSKYGIAPIQFNSKFELFEYVACRLSLRGLLDSVVNSLVSQMLEFVSKFEVYLDIDWWLNNTVWGKVLNTYLSEYENFFNDRIKPFLDKLVPYLDCSFALCDFKVSTTNYFDDFSTKFKTERKQTTDLSFEWTISKKELYADLTSSLNDAKSEVTIFKSTLMAPVVASKPLFHNRQAGESYEQESSQNVSQAETEKLPYNSEELSKVKYDLYNRKSSLTPGLRENQYIALRPTIRLSSPNSGE
jgi:hypothetical protein